MMGSWGKAWSLAIQRNPHYSLDENSHRELYRVMKSVFKNNEKPVVLELGVCHGRTSVLLMAMGCDYSGIDHFGLEGSAAELKRWLAENNLTGVVIEGYTQDAPWDRDVDALILDAGHDEYNVKGDVAKYVPFIKPGGVLIADDYDDSVGAHWAVKKYVDEATVGWPCEKAGRLTVFRRPKEVAG